MELEGGALYQWDTGRRVKSDAAEVHFATQPYKTYDVVVKDGAARVPDELLQRAGTLRCWAWTGSRTLEAEAFEVTARNKPSAYAYEPTTQREIADAIRAKEDAEAARDEAQGFAATAKGHADAAASKAQEATERAGDCEAAEGRAQDAANAAAGYAERAKASADAASASAETVAQGIGDEAKARADADARLAADLAAETAGRKADTQGALEERTRIEREYKAADKAFDSKLTGGLNSITGGLTAVGNGLTAEQKARADADTALGKRIDDAALKVFACTATGTRPDTDLTFDKVKDVFANSVVIANEMYLFPFWTDGKSKAIYTGSRENTSGHRAAIVSTNSTSVAEHLPTWDEIVRKPFSTIGSGLKVVSDALVVDTSALSTELVAPLVVKVENNVPAKTFGEMQQAMLAGRPVYWTDGLLTFAAVQMEHGGLRARVGLNVSGGAITSATFWELAPNADAITESSYSF